MFIQCNDLQLRPAGSNLQKSLDTKIALDYSKFLSVCHAFLLN